MSGPIGILGATGYTGRLVVERAREAGLPLRLVGRSRDVLARLAREGEDVRVADGTDRGALLRAFEDCAAVVSLAGPFLRVGPEPVAAAIAAGAHYLDSSGEQAWSRLLFDRFAEEAQQAGLSVLPCFGFDYVPGDLAARLAADGLEPLDEIVVAYSVAGATTSRGTRRTIGRVMEQPLVAFEDGRLVPSRVGATTRRVRFPFGERTVVEWSGTEPLTVPRHTDVRSVRSYVRGPRVAAVAGRLARVTGPLVRLTARVGPLGPAEERRQRARFAVVAEARGPGGARRATLTGTDPYDLTALLLVRGAERLRAGSGRAAGVVAPAEVFDAAELAASLAPLLQIEPPERI